MKKILLDPNKPYYKANMHCHSTKSDGLMTVEEIKAHYKAHGYSIVAYTDHEHLVDNSYLNDQDFLTITSCELGIKEFEQLSTLKKQDMKVCHLNLYAKDPSNIDTPCYSSVYDHYAAGVEGIVHSCGEYQRKYSPEGISEMIRIANAKGFLVAYNHPRWSLENATDYLGYQGLWAVEIYNHSCHCAGIFEYDINTYDDFLRDGQPIACVAGDDNHKITATCGGYIMINADRLEYGVIMNALENHNFYASTGPVIKSLYIEDNVAYMTFEKGNYAVMATKGRRVEKQMASDPDGENAVQFKILPGEDGYVRFDVVDSCGRRANTCAYFLGEQLSKVLPNFKCPHKPLSGTPGVYSWQ